MNLNFDFAIKLISVKYFTYSVKYFTYSSLVWTHTQGDRSVRILIKWLIFFSFY
jgi:hypothetical protein